MYIVIMAGGKGTRFWPRSTASTPKQLLDIIGGRTMIQESVKRILPIVPKENIFIVTNREHADDLRSQLPDIPNHNIIGEPFGRNTAACICLAATLIHNYDPEAIMAVLPADHYIGKENVFCQCLENAAEAARKNRALITIGIYPKKPETGYGYIQFDKQSDSAQKGVYRVTNFHEKPDLKTAEEYVYRGNFLWNSGMFVWRVSVILQELKKLLPETYRHIVKVKPYCNTPEIEKAIAKAYDKIESISIDYGVMEKSDNVFTLKGDFDWNDIGNWSAIHDISIKDKDFNVLRGDVVAIESNGVLVYSPKKLTAIVGLEDIIIVETDDALLVCSRDKAQDVRKVVDVLEKSGRREYI
jgi:mannose-1-phosphate guanylyltransferase